MIQAPEQRTVDVDVEALDTRGRTLHGYAAVYGIESHDLGGFRERIEPGAFAGVLDADVRALLNHDPNQVLGWTRSGTLRLRDEERGLRFECDLPDSPLGQNVQEAVRRGDVDGASFSFVVGDEEWDGELRTIKSVSELHDVTVATYGAYPAASVELRTRPATKEEPQMENTTEGDQSVVAFQGETSLRSPHSYERSERSKVAHSLTVEDRSAAAGPTVEQRVIDALRSIRKGESRSLSTTSPAEITPPELFTYLWDRLRPASIALASGLRVISTDREKISWPRLVSEVSPGWVAEGAKSLRAIPASSTDHAAIWRNSRELS